MQELISFATSFFTLPSSGTSDGILSLNFLMKGGVFYLVIIWLACVIWVIKDVTNRSESLILQVISILLVTGLTPIFGLPIYFLIRPSTTLFERYYEQSSLLALEGESEESIAPKAIEMTRCNTCDGIISSHDRFCPHCGEELLDSCAGCGAKLQREWKFCNSCGKKRGESQSNIPKSSTPTDVKINKIPGEEKEIENQVDEETPLQKSE